MEGCVGIQSISTFTPIYDILDKKPGLKNGHTASPGRKPYYSINTRVVVDGWADSCVGRQMTTDKPNLL